MAERRSIVMAGGLSCIGVYIIMTERRAQRIGPWVVADEVAEMASSAGGNSFAESLGMLFNLAQAQIDWTTVAKAVLAFREHERQQWLDEHDELSESPRSKLTDVAAVRRVAIAGSDANALYVEVSAALLTSLIRTGQDWQRLLEEWAPSLKDAVDDYAAELDPSPRQTRDLINELVRFTQAVGEFIHDQGAQIEHDLRELQAETLGLRPDDGTPSLVMRRVKV